MSQPVAGIAQVRLPGWQPQAGSVPRRPAATLAQGDRLEFSPDALGINRLLGTWDILTRLLGGRTPAGLGSGPDLLALRQALIQARENLEKMQLRQDVLRTLKSSALRQAEELVGRVYGLKGDGASITVHLEEEMGDALASVSYLYDRQGRMADLNLNVGLGQFRPDSGPNGINNHVIENDRIIAHEMTHAVMGRSMDIRALPDWFMEGTAEYVAGGAERVSIVLERYSPAWLVARLAAPWEGDTTQYAAAYLAVRYLDQAIAGGGGIRELMAALSGGQSLDEAIHQVGDGRFSSVRDFLRQFVSGEGEAFMRTLDLSGREPGAIGGGRGPNVVPDGGRPMAQPLRYFHVEWPSPLEGIQWQTASPWPPLPGFGIAAYQRQRFASMLTEPAARSTAS